MKKRFPRFIAAAAALFVLATGCVANARTLNIPIDAEPDSLDLARVSDALSFEMTSQVLEGLTVMSADESGNIVPVPGIAESWETSEDGLTWTFHLRDAVWSDGKPVTAQDFEYGIKRIGDPEVASPIIGNAQFIKNIEAAAKGKASADEIGVHAEDDKTLVVELAYPVPYFLSACAGNAMYPQRKDIIEKFGSSYGTEPEYFVGNGAFEIKEWIHNSAIAFEKSDSYWNKDSVKLDSFNFKIITDENARVGEFEKGDLDTVSVSTPEWIARLDSMKKYDKHVVCLPRTRYVFFNQKTKLFSNEKVRRAFSAVINREEIAKYITMGMEEAAYGWLPPSLNLDGVSFRTLAGEPVKKLISEVKDPRALLSEGLAELGMDTDPTKLEITMMVRNTWQNMGEYFQHLFNSKLGVNIHLDPVEWPVFQERNRGLDYEISFKSYGADCDDPFSMMQMWITGRMTVPTGWSCEEYDNLVREANRSMDSELRKANYIKAEQLVIESATIAPYGYATSIEYRQKDVRGIHDTVFTPVLYKDVYVESN